MIKNDRQLQVSLRQRTLLAEALAETVAAEQSSMVTRAHRAGLQRDLDRLDAEITQYRAAFAGHADLEALQTLSHVGEDLIKARIARHLTQGELARRLGKDTQQIQRYERTSYAKASLATLQNVAAVLADADGEQEQLWANS